MKLAVVIRGISYYDEGISTGVKSNVDYRECLQSYKTVLIPVLKKLFDSIDVYLVTYYSDKLCNIVNDYNPKDIILLPKCEISYGGTNEFLAGLIAKSLDFVQKWSHTEDYDYILQTRFDLYYYQPPLISRFQLDKVNFAWKGESGQCDDSFVLIPKRYIGPLVEYLSSGRCTHYMNTVIPNADRNYISKDLDPENGYHFPDFYIIARFLERYWSGNIKTY